MSCVGTSLRQARANVLDLACTRLDSQPVRVLLSWALGTCVTLAAWAVPGLTVTPLEIDFGPVGVGFSSPQLTVTITNTGDSVLAGFAGGGVSAPFSAAQNCAGGVAPGASCQYFFTFSPTDIGPFTTTSNSGSDAGNFTITLHGTGVGAGLQVTPLEIDFGPVVTSTTSPQLAVEITNNGLAVLEDFAGGGVGLPFSAAQNCAGGVAPGASCQYFFTFSPTAIGPFTTTSNSGSNAGNFAITLHGEGVSSLPLSGPGLSVTPLVIDFGEIGVGLSSAMLTATISNPGDATLTNFAGGGVNSPFSAAQNCAAGVAAGGSCQYFFTFSPTDIGFFETTSNSGTNAGSFTVTLRGTGVGADVSVSPLVLDFGPVVVGTTSPQQTATISNTGLAELNGFAGGGVAGPFSAAQNCAAGVAPGASCQYFFAFSPTVVGAAQTTSNSGTAAGPFAVELLGFGVSAGSSSAVDPLLLDFGGVPPGSSALTQLVTFTNTSILPLDVTGVSAPAPFSVLSETCTPALGPAASCEISVGFDPTDGVSYNELLTIESADPDSPTTVQLIGFGFAPNLIPTGGPLAWTLMIFLLAATAMWTLGGKQT